MSLSVFLNVETHTEATAGRECLPLSPLLPWDNSLTEAEGSSQGPPVSSPHSRGTLSHACLSEWALGIPTRALALAEQGFLLGEPICSALGLNV